MKRLLSVALGTALALALAEDPMELTLECLERQAREQ